MDNAVYPPEYANMLLWARGAATSGRGLDGAAVPQSVPLNKRIRAEDEASLQHCLMRDSEPAIITDAFEDWTALHKWTLDWLKHKYTSYKVLVNDRAPARRRDAQSEHPQRSMQLELITYIDYLQELPETLQEMAAQNRPVPFYANGWAFSNAVELLQDCPGPHFARCLDHTDLILSALERNMRGDTSIPPAAESQDSVTRANLTKLFLGPPGTVTRLHYDAGESHGWLGQIQGRKLFVLFPPWEGHFLHPIPGEVETQQAAVDPLSPDLDSFPEYGSARPMTAVLEAGEAILIPRGWWHYAVALERSVTVMRNFYHAGSNAAAMVELVLKSFAASRDMTLEEMKHTLRIRDPAVTSSV